MYAQITAYMYTHISLHIKYVTMDHKTSHTYIIV